MGINKLNRSDKTKPFKGSGKKGESLFHNFFVQAVADEIKLIDENYTRYLSYIRRANDDRLLAIVGALAVEEALDFLLGSYIPEFKILQGNNSTTFRVKIDLARSLKLIPAHLLHAVDVIHKIRNEFAHELSKDNFDSLKSKNELVKIFKELHPEDDVNNFSTSVMFGTTISCILVSFGAYASNLKIAKNYIYSDDFLQKIKEIIKSHSK